MVGMTNRNGTLREIGEKHGPFAVVTPRTNTDT
jgi:hypothetical protein